MPHFFKKSSLSEEKIRNWESYIKTYNDVISYNIETDQVKGQDSDMMRYMFQAGDEKSALFNRILNNKKPLVFPPPLSYSYPEYSFIESDKKKEIDVLLMIMNHQIDYLNFSFPDWIMKITNQHHQLINSLKQLKIDDCLVQKLFDEEPLKMIIIDQCYWNVLDIINDHEVILSFGKWINLGLKWKLSYKEISISELCSKDENNEFYFDRFNCLGDEDTPIFTRNHLMNWIKKNLARIEKFKSFQLINQSKNIQQILESVNKNELMTDSKVSEESIKNELDYYLNHGYFFKDEILFKKTFILEKIKPDGFNQETIYLK